MFISQTETRVGYKHIHRPRKGIAEFHHFNSKHRLDLVSLPHVFKVVFKMLRVCNMSDSRLSVGV